MRTFVGQDGILRGGCQPPRGPIANRPAAYQAAPHAFAMIGRVSGASHESRHRPRHHQFGAGLHRRARGGGPRFSAGPCFRDAATGGRRARRSAPHAAFVPVPRRGAAGGRLRARAGRAGAHAAGAFGQILALESRRGPHRQDPALGFAGDRARAFAGGSFGAHHRPSSARSGTARRARRWPSRTSSSPCRPRSTKRRAS